MSDSGSARRPYRSHRVPACDACKRRRTRCVLEDGDDACLFCRLKRTNCQREGRSLELSEPSQAGPSRKRKRARQSPSTTNLGNHPKESSISWREEDDREDPKSIHIVGPLATSDKRVLETSDQAQHILDITDAPNPRVSTGNSIMFRRVNRVRPGKHLEYPLGKRQWEIMVNVVRRENVPEIMSIYRKIVHPCFPIMRYDDFEASKPVPNLKPPLLCTVVALTALFWDTSPALRSTARPDLQYLWNIAVDGLSDDFQAPSTSTIVNALLDLTGRPSLNVLGNEGTIGRVIAAAYSIGLNCEPGESAEEDFFRRRVWWGIVIHDTWASLAHGTPPMLDSRYWNVQCPKMQDVTHASNTKDTKKPLECFLALCRLTKILSEILPHVYAFDHEAEAQENTHGLGVAHKQLNEWYEDLPTWLTSCWQPRTIAVNGSSSLCFSYLAIKLTLARLELRRHKEVSSQYASSLNLCRDTATTMAEFIIGLEKHDSQGFWLPYSADHITMTATVLLRCVVQEKSTPDGSRCLETCKTMMSKLKTMRDSFGWDLGDDCIDQCSSILERVQKDFQSTHDWNADTDADADSVQYYNLPELTGFGITGFEHDFNVGMAPGSEWWNDLGLD